MDDMKEQLDRLWDDLDDLEEEVRFLREENERLRSAMPYPHVKGETLRDAWDCFDKTGDNLMKCEEILLDCLEGDLSERKLLGEALTDVITRITTVLQILGYGEDARMVLQQKVNEKNR